MIKKAVSLGLLVIVAASASAVEFPEVRGTLHSVGNLDLSQVTLEARLECSDPKTGDCGKLSVNAKIDAATSTFVIPAMDLDPMGMSGKYEGYFSDGWGKRFDYDLIITVNGHVAFHDLNFWSWEARPGNTLAGMMKDVPRELANITVYHASQKSRVHLTPASAFQGHELKIRIQKQFLPTAASKNHADIAKGWMLLDLTKVTAKDPFISAELLPVHMVVRGQVGTYGELPKTRTVIHVYKKITDKKFKFLGLADETSHFSGKGLFEAATTTVDANAKLPDDIRMND